MPVYTVAAADRAFNAVAADCVAYDVTMLVDLRDVASIPTEGEMSAPEVAAIAGEAGFGYRWLGGRLPLRSSDAAAAVCDELLGLAANGVVALLCQPREPAHRIEAAALAACLADRGLALMHIDHDGVAEPHQEQLDL